MTKSNGEVSRLPKKIGSFERFRLSLIGQRAEEIGSGEYERLDSTAIISKGLGGISLKLVNHHRSGRTTTIKVNLGFNDYNSVPYISATRTDSVPGTTDVITDYSSSHEPDSNTMSLHQVASAVRKIHVIQRMSPSL